MDLDPVYDRPFKINCMVSVRNFPERYEGDTCIQLDAEVSPPTFRTCAHLQDLFLGWWLA